jgi:hypothetical protein
MSPSALLKAIVCLVVVFWTPRISLAERSHSTFALVVSCLQVRSFFLFLVVPVRDASRRSKPMKDGHRTGILSLRVLMDGILFYGEENVLNESDFHFRKLWNIFWSVFWLQTSFVYFKREPKL